MSTGGIPSRLRLEYPRLGKAEEGKQSPAYSKLFFDFCSEKDSIWVKGSRKANHKRDGTQWEKENVGFPQVSTYNENCNVRTMTRHISLSVYYEILSSSQFWGK